MFGGTFAYFITYLLHSLRLKNFSNRWTTDEGRQKKVGSMNPALEIFGYGVYSVDSVSSSVWRPLQVTFYQ